MRLAKGAKNFSGKPHLGKLGGGGASSGQKAPGGRAGCPGLLWDINFLGKEGKHKRGKSEHQAEGAGW